ncbi:DUF2190 domain-containing protein [Enemella dayhoffiae]|uniref:DUF2190 domain-containing protein n=1 Tax=Enemella dayhoffiae TaxID=2016507 RepID=A0A255GLD8_9ACTN|nr:capsid cement protein [Enemella dayhoffiae]OYO16629.1 DUF2190 domain-containing protein [Enemella dayhoffiae]
MGDYLPRFKPGEAVSFNATTALTGGQLVELTGPRSVGVAAAASTKVVGVAAFDCKVGDRVLVHSGGVQRPVASAAIAAGDQVQAAANGQAATGTTAPIGLALTAATAGARVEVQMNR